MLIVVWVCLWYSNLESLTIYEDLDKVYITENNRLNLHKCGHKKDKNERQKKIEKITYLIKRYWKGEFSKIHKLLNINKSW